MKKAMWISRHPATMPQRAEIEAAGFALVGEAEGRSLGGRDLQDDEDVRAWLSELDSHLETFQVSECFGVLAVPLQVMLAQHPNEELWGLTWLPFNLAWNVSRSEEGKAPTFAHLKFVGTFLVY